jgi:hypothetical protein
MRAWLLLTLAFAGCGNSRPSAPLTSTAGGESSSAGAGGSGAADAGGTCTVDETPHAWAHWKMPNPASSQLPNPMGYTVSGSGNLVHDDVTGLTWQRQSSEPLGWDAAKRFCACANVDGQTGFRLPSRIELASLVDWSRPSPSIDTGAFGPTPTENYWTTSEVSQDPGLIYLVYFVNGHTTYAEQTLMYRARCVKLGQSDADASPRPSYTTSADTVLDAGTNLTWQRAVPAMRYGWQDATQYCAELDLTGGGWRLPSIGELQTLVDETVNPSIDAAAFPMTPSEYFWSSSPVIDDATRAWTAFFTNGSTYSFAITALKNVRCVR